MFVKGRNDTEERNIMWNKGREYFVAINKDKQRWLTV